VEELGARSNAAEIVEDLEAALEQYREIANDLGAKDSES
jgi:hypothetical protein